MNVLLKFGIRPEAIEKAPLVKRHQREPRVARVVYMTGRCRGMPDQELNIESQKDLVRNGVGLKGVLPRRLRTVKAAVGKAQNAVRIDTRPICTKRHRGMS